MKRRALVTGGNEGLGAEIVAHFPSSLGVSRRNGFDLKTPEARARVVEMSLEYDIFVNHAHTGHFEGQTLLTYELFNAWKSHGKRGYIFHTGSVATYDPGTSYKRYAIIKFGADQACRQVCRALQNGEAAFRLTNLRAGSLAQNAESRSSNLGPLLTGHDYIATMEALLALPETILVPELVVQGRV